MPLEQGHGSGNVSVTMVYDTHSGLQEGSGTIAHGRGAQESDGAIAQL